MAAAASFRVTFGCNHDIPLRGSRCLTCNDDFIHVDMPGPILGIQEVVGSNHLVDLIAKIESLGELDKVFHLLYRLKIQCSGSGTRRWKEAADICLDQAKTKQTSLIAQSRMQEATTVTSSAQPSRKRGRFSPLPMIVASSRGGNTSPF